MKLNLFLIAILTLSTSQVFSQKYKTTADSTKLNSELLKVTGDISSLTTKLTKAQMDLPSYKLKASTSGNEARTAASASRDESLKATNGKLNDSKNAKKRAKQAYVKAKDSRTASQEVTLLENKIISLTSQINKKNQWLQELKVMKAAIISNTLLPPPPILEP